MDKVLVDRELLPCPFCGQQDAFVEQLDSDASVVICQGMVDEHSACLARGPVGVQQSDLEDQPGRDAAIAEWNRRAQPAPAQDEREAATDAAYAAIVDGGWSSVKEMGVKMFQAGAEWVRATRPAQTEQPPIAVQVCKLGIYGKAYDAPETKRAYTYAEQPDNVGAMKLGRAVRAASSASAGDEIDRGLALLHALAAEGFGVFAVGAEYSAEGDIGG